MAHDKSKDQFTGSDDQPHNADRGIFHPKEPKQRHQKPGDRQHIAKYAMPYDIEFRPELPKTLVGKVAYRVLEEEAEKEQHA